ncbi:ROK family transcriptional regulator [Devosia sp.]|uniref:ROK family transcriptional regulator n=1 Tax=Devosia sp. TaxID=1871048 RepID=UPI003A92E344
MALRGTNQEFGRPYNRRIVLEAVRLYGPTTRGHIAQQVGLTVQTVSTIVRELEEQGFLLTEKKEPRGRGLPPTTLRLNPDGGYAIGVHVTPLGVDVGLIDLNGDVVASRTRAIADMSPDQAFAEIRDLSAELRAERPDSRMLGVGMALPGPFDITAMSFVGPTTLRGWGGVNLRQRLTEATGLPAFIEVDMAAAALGERLYGAGGAYPNFYYLFFGFGLGGAMVHDGAVLRGAWGNAGEIGHMPVVLDGEACPCGNHGCLERYVSLEAFNRRPPGTSETDWARMVAPMFRAAVTTVENLFDPQTVIIGGLAPVSLLSALIDTTQQLPNSVSARSDRQAPRVILSDGGADTVLRGAAALAVSGVLSPRFGQLFAGDGKDHDPLSKRIAA